MNILDKDNITTSMQANIDAYGIRRMPDQQWHILDWSAVTKHCFYGTNLKELDVKTGDQIPTVGGAIRFFFSRYGHIIFDSEQACPIHILIAKDWGTDYRTKLFPGYKAKRKERKKERERTQEIVNLETFSNTLEKILLYSGSTSIRVKGVEADDIVAWLSYLPGTKQVYTNDHDLLALHGQRQTFVSLKAEPHASAFVPPAKDCTEIAPKYMTLAKSLLGDTSDEYPGVKGLGSVKWNALVKAFGAAGLDTLLQAVSTNKFEHLEEFLSSDLSSVDKDAVKAIQLAYDNRYEWSNMYQVANLHPWLCWMPHNNRLTKPEWNKRVPSATKVKELCLSVGCEDMYNEHLKVFMPTENLIDSTNWQDDFPTRLAEQVSESPLLAYDYETYDTLQHQAFQEASSSGTYVDVISQEVTGASYCWGNNLQHVIYVTINHDGSHNLPKSKLVELQTAAVQSSFTHVAHNAPFEMAVSKNSLGHEVWDSHDTLIMSQEVDENDRSGLKHLSKAWLRYDQTEYKEVVPEGMTMKDIPAKQVVSYGCDDSLVTAHLYWLMYIQMNLESTYDFYCENNVAPQNILADCHLKGFKVDWNMADRIASQDAETVRVEKEKLKGLLETHLEKNEVGECIQQIENAKRFFNEDLEYYKTKGLADAEKLWQKFAKGEAKNDSSYKPYYDVGDVSGFNKQFVEDRLDKILTDLMTASQYREYTEEEKAPDWKPTEIGLSKVADALGLPKFEKDSANYIREYCTGMSANAPTDPSARKFIGLLYRTVNADNASTNINSWAFTAKWMSQTAELLGLPEIHKLTKSYIGGYLMPGNTTKETVEGQHEFLRLLELCKELTPSSRKGDREMDPNYQALKKLSISVIAKDNEERETKGEKADSELKSFAISLLKIPGKKVSYGTEIDLKSAPKSKNLLYLLLGSEVYIRGKKSQGSLRAENRLPGSPSANALALKWYAANADQEWKKQAVDCMSKIKAAIMREGLYHSKYPKWLHPTTGKLHPGFRWAATTTGRPTGSNPNLLQISQTMRQVFIPYQDSHVLVGIDWAGLELRITAGQCGDKAMVSAYWGMEEFNEYKDKLPVELRDKLWDKIKDSEGKVDLHSFTGAGMAGMSYESFLTVYKEQEHPEHGRIDKIRKAAKVINFGLIYGMSSLAVSEKLIISRALGDEYVDAYFAQYPGMGIWQKKTEAYAKQYGFTRTAYGSIRHAEDDLFSREGWKVGRQSRQLGNATIQGTAADMLKITMSKLWKSGLYHQADVAYVIPIYDEILSSVEEEWYEAYVEGMRYLMEAIVPTTIPMPMETDVAAGYNWGGMYEMGSKSFEEQRDKLAELKQEEIELKISYDAIEEEVESDDE